MGLVGVQMAWAALLFPPATLEVALYYVTGISSPDVPNWLFGEKVNIISLSAMLTLKGKGLSHLFFSCWENHMG